MKRIVGLVISMIALVVPVMIASAASAPSAGALPVAACTGTLKVHNTDNNTDIGFVSKTWNFFGEYVVTTTPADYLSVSLTPNSPEVNITATNPQDPTYPLLGGIVGFSSTSNDIGAGSSNNTYLGGTTSTTAGAPPQVGANSFTNATAIPERIESAIWSIDPSTLVATPQWVNTDTSLPATHLVDHAGNLLLTGDTTAFQNTFGPSTNVSLTLVPTTTCPVPPVITTAFGAATVPLNGTTSLSYTITNPAGHGTASGVAFTDTLPAGLVVATPNGLTGSCGGGTITATAGSGTVTLTGASLADGASCTISVNVAGTTAGTKNNSVTVTSTSGGTGNTASATVAVLAAPQIAKGFGSASAPAGTPVSLTFTLTNPNTAAALTGVAFTDTFPAGLVVSTPNGLTGSCGGGTITAVAGSGTVTLTGATLAAAPPGTCIFSVNVTGTTVGTKNNSVTVTSTNGGTGNTASASITIDVISSVVFTTAPISGPEEAGAALGPITVQIRDQSNNPINAPTGGTTVALASTSTGSPIFAAFAGGPSITSIKIPAGHSSVNFFYGDLKAGSPTITATVTGVPAVTQVETISPITLAASVGGTSTPYTLYYTDTSGGAVSIGHLTVTNPTFQVQTDSCSNTKLPNGATCRAHVVFSPTAHGNQNGQLNIPSSSGTVTLDLLGIAP